MKVVAALLISVGLGLACVTSWADEAAPSLPGPASPTYQEALERHVKTICTSTDRETLRVAHFRLNDILRETEDVRLDYIYGQLIKVRPRMMDVVGLGDETDETVHLRLRIAARKGVLPAIQELADWHAESEDIERQEEAMGYYLYGRLLGLDNEEKILAYEMEQNGNFRTTGRISALGHYESLPDEAVALWKHPNLPRGKRPHPDWPCAGGPLVLKRLELPDFASDNPKARLNTMIIRQCGDLEGKIADVLSRMNFHPFDVWSIIEGELICHDPV